MGASSEDFRKIISAPQGGGALKGIGETFSPDLHTGTGNFTVPIALPPGRNGFKPELSVVYSTGNGNGPFGLGWSLSVPGVSRKTSKGIPRYQDYSADLKARDTFVLSGAEDLVPVSDGSSGMTRYRPRSEGRFARIEHHHDVGSGQNYWEVHSKDGLVSLYGTPDSAGEDSAAVADPADRTEVFAWKLTRTRDPFGSRIDYEYERDSARDGPHDWDQLYLKRIRYADYSDNDFLVSVTFVYEERPDPCSEYRPGFEIRTRQRCRRIEVRTHANEERLIRTYEFVYLDQTEELTQNLPLNGVSLLSQVKVTGHDGDKTESLPALEFGYTRFQPERRDLLPFEGPDLPAQSLAHPDLEMVDLFGNGLPDILEMNGSVRYWRNLGAGRFDLPLPVPEAPAGLALAQAGVQIIDANGDARADLLVTTQTLTGYYPMKFDGLWDRRSFRRYRTAPSFDLKDPEVRLVDLDGDGVTDAIRSGSRLECFFNDPKTGWEKTRFVERQRIEDFPNVNFSDPRVQWADMTGDGMQDIVLIHDGNVDYWPSMGHGNWGKRVSMRHCPRFPDGYDPRRILLGDLDGDGAADLVYVDHCKVTLWINRSGNGWSDPQVIGGTPAVTDRDNLRLTDALGNGTGGVLFSSEADAVSRVPIFFLDFTGGIKPYLLNEMNNQTGALIRVDYAPSTRYYLEDQSSRKTRWKTSLPFPVQVVASVQEIDEISGGKLTTEYRYHHGYWDGAEREFRGFGRVDRLDTEVFDRYQAPGLDPDKPFEPVDKALFSPPVETRTWFHQGPVGHESGEWVESDYRHEFWSGDPSILERPADVTALLKGLPRRVRRDALRSLRGSILRTELYAHDGTARQDRPYTVTESLYGIREEEEPDPGDEDRYHIFFSHTLAERTTQWERGDDPMTRFDFTGDYDDYGQPQLKTRVACPRGWRELEIIPGKPYLATRTRTQFARRDDPQLYIVDRVAKTTAYEIENDGSEPLMDIKDTPDGGGALKIIGQSLNHYDGEAFVGLPTGQLGDFGALVRTKSLVLTDQILHRAYQSGDTVLNPPEVPPYLDPDDPPAWAAEYPLDFKSAMTELPSLAGYDYDPGDGELERGYFVNTAQTRYDFQVPQVQDARGLPFATRDPLGRETTIEYDDFLLFAVQFADPAGLTTQAEYDYRVFQPARITDPNGNRTAFTFSPLGMLDGTVVMGKEDGEQAGDTPEMPGTRVEYDFFAFQNSPPEDRRPMFVRTIRREHHFHDTGVPVPQRDDTIETVEYSDGFGRLIQTRTQAEDLLMGDPVFGHGVLPADQADSQGTQADVAGLMRAPGAPPNVVITGWKTYNNKGWVVERCEPFHQTGWDYLSRREAEALLEKPDGDPDKVDLFGRKSVMHYDPRGQVIRAVNPDGSEQRVIYGTPEHLADPDTFTASPWEAYTYDANDNAGRTHGTGDPTHWNTPASIVVDGLGRTVTQIARNGNELYVTRSAYDIRGNLLTVIDPLERLVFQHAYDLADHALRIESSDAGLRRIVLDAAANEVERRDSKGALILQSYDRLNRTTEYWARDAAPENLSLREHLIYGDSPTSGLTPPQAAAANLLGKPYRHFDEAGLLTCEAYDFKGNILEKVRQAIADDSILAAFDPPPPDWDVRPFRIDWQPADGSTLTDHATDLLDSAEYRTSTAYDALNRVKTMRYPEDVDGQRKELKPEYSQNGALMRVTLDGAAYVEHTAYNARGQRTLCAYGNGVMTRYAYHPQTFRLARMRTESYGKPDAVTFHPVGKPLQDFAYETDLSGNITELRDRTPESGIPNSNLGLNALDRTFTYDPLYRLISATGREQAVLPPNPPWVDTVKSQDPNLTRAYGQAYQYDKAGNLRQLQHTASAGNFTRGLELVPGNNRLKTVTIGSTEYDYAYDANGNMIRETTTRHYEWDHSDQMRAFRTQAGSAEPSLHAHYLYDSDGRRVKKLVRKQGGQYESTVYVDGLFEHHTWTAGSRKSNNRVHVMDDQQRIALVRVGEAHPDDSGPVIQYHLGDHLGSSSLVVNDTGKWTNRDEHTPYGETSLGSFARKRYRFTAKERDEESGLYYHGQRYYACWLGRWTATDPAGLVDGVNIYAYVNGNPVMFRDPSGMNEEQIQQLTQQKTLLSEQLKASQKIQQTWEKGVKWRKARPYLNKAETREFMKRADVNLRQQASIQSGLNEQVLAIDKQIATLTKEAGPGPGDGLAGNISAEIGPGGVEFCHGIAGIEWMATLRIHHHWLRTPNKEGGQSTVPGQPHRAWYDEGPDLLTNDGPQTHIDTGDTHSGRGAKPGNTCIPVHEEYGFTVDVECVDEQLTHGRILGKYGITNNCWTTVDDIVSKCRIWPAWNDPAFITDPNAYERSIGQRRPDLRGAGGAGGDLGRGGAGGADR